MKTPVTTSIFSLFKVGPGPSSSHTIAPMQAAYDFLREVRGLPDGMVGQARSISVRLFGSLSATGAGHGTEEAVRAGFAGHAPSDSVGNLLESPIETDRGAALAAGRTLPVVIVRDAVEHGFPFSNTMVMALLDGDGNALFERECYSVGGGFVRWSGGTGRDVGTPEHPYARMDELHAVVRDKGLSLYEIMLDNEVAVTGRRRTDVIHDLNDIIQRMDESVIRGLDAVGKLPGPLGVCRKAGMLWRRAKEIPAGPDAFLARLSAYAFATAEENASGGRIVTAPTCGAAGVMPALIHAMRHDIGIGDRAIREGFLAAAAVGFIAKHNASISGAEVGCQGEIGVASAMAAAMLTDARGNRFRYTENAAEIALEHHLGLTCDPVGGYVQIPCIERNAMGTVKAYAASVIATGTDPYVSKVSLDAAIAAMAETGRDMDHKFKETALGGLAVSMVMC